MATYVVTKRSYIGGELVEPGTVVEYAGEPGSNLEPAPKAAKPKPPPEPPPAKLDPMPTSPAWVQPKE